MSKGLIGGLVWGVVLGGLGLTVVSLLTPLPPAPVGQGPEPAVAPAPAPTAAAEAPAAQLPPATPTGAAVSVTPDAAGTTPPQPAREAPAAPEAAPTAAAPAAAPAAVAAPPAEPQPAAEAAQVALPASGDSTAPPAAPGTPAAAAPEAAPAATPLPQIAPPPSADAAAAPAPAPSDESAPAEGAARPVPGSEAGFAARDTGVRVNRLPSIGLPSTEPASADAAPQAPAARALDRYAAPFDNAEAKPLMSLVVLDLGTAAGGLDQAALADMPFPVTFAVPADRPDALEAARAHRAAGFEVAMVAGALPESATPADLEVSFEVFAAAVPEAVAVLDAPEGGFQASRPLSAQVVAILAAGGQGLLTHDRGLNSAEQIAQREGVPAARVFRDLDPAPQDAEALRRTLDRAVLRATQEGGVIVLARSRPETLQAIFAWALEGRAEGVALAPVSAQLGAR